MMIPCSPALLVISSVLYSGHGFIDNFVVFMLFWKRIDRRSLWWTSTICFIISALKLTLLLTLGSRYYECQWCALFVPSSESVYIYVPLIALYSVCLLASYGHVPHLTSRPAVRYWLIFMLVCYGSSSVGIGLVGGGFDYGYCHLFVTVTIYNAVYVLLLYRTLVKDTSDYIAARTAERLLASPAPSSNGSYRTASVATLPDASAAVAFSSSADSHAGHGSPRYIPPGTPLGQRVPDVDLEERMREAGLNLIPFSTIKISSKIGVGGYGEVYRGVWQGTQVAIKRITSFRAVRADNSLMDSFLSEASLVSRLRHPNIVLFLGVAVHGDKPYLLTEYAGRGSLYDVMHENREPLTFHECVTIGKDVARGLAYLHGLSPPMLHRDVKSHNILLSHDAVAKLCDFGLSREAEDETMSRIGTTQWSAPEVLRGERYDAKADIFGFGVVLWEMLAASIPHEGVDALVTAHRVAFGEARLTVPDWCPSDIAKVINACLDPDASKRPTTKEVLAMLDKCEGSTTDSPRARKNALDSSRRKGKRRGKKAAQ